MTQPRKAERVRTLMSAQVMYGAAPAIDCIVKNFSPAGVRLEISDRTPLPNEFDLNIPAQGPHLSRAASPGAATASSARNSSRQRQRGAAGNDGDQLSRLMKTELRRQASTS